MREGLTSRFWRRNVLLPAAALALGIVVATVAQGQSDDGAPAVETLGPQQTIDVRVGRWDPIQETYANWEAFGGAFSISARGTVTLPMIGQLDAAGMTPDELGLQIAQQVQDRMGLSGEVQAIVTITEFAPIYVLGDVRAPGAYPHAPRMTVLQALSLAGGIDRASPALVRGERSALNSLGSYRVMELELLRRLATLSRLEAEEAGSEMAPPDELLASVVGPELIAQERRIMIAQRAALESSLAQIDELEALLEERISRLTTQAELRQTQLALLEEELGNAASLVERGLSTVARQSGLQRQVADQQVRLLEVETARLNAEQQLNETRRDRLDLINERSRERVQGLQDQRAAIGELRIRMETEAALFAEATRTGNGLVELSALSPPELQITRTGPDGPITLSVRRDDLIEGGDVLEVVLDAPGPNDTIPVRRLPFGSEDLPPPGALSGADPRSEQRAEPRSGNSVVPPS
ncbi:polysaccharide biosynthesis/export family protein [uncultured Roseobacter sp.]|uniref:polysaccharide biosynthesis/export family protein n=1 Tax=uncultured Roseobacter sp. TaxID=114847 RepID=UPI00262C3CC5|nr:polysaccharide biosynthesis/export family protein [uncultured Roseobacter sp.]